jgi:hypothetical protein
MTLASTDGVITAATWLKGSTTSKEVNTMTSRPARWAVGIAGVVAAAIVVSFALFAVAYAVGGSAAVDDTWIGLILVVSLLGGLAASLVAFVLAVMATVRHGRWGPLWFPLALFPAILAFLVVGELFWWE